MSPDRTRIPNEDSQKYTIESISNVFTCFICLSRVKNARLCPHCSKLCCYDCISKWIMQSRAQCPHCLNTLHLMDLVHCRWAEEITQRLNHLQILKNNEKKLTDLDKCKSHNEPLSVYCSTCSRIVCHQCALFDTKHNKHQFKPLDDVVKNKIKDLTSDIKSLEERRTSLNHIIDETNQQISKLTQVKEERSNEIRSNMELMGTRLENEYKSRLAKLLSHKHRILQETKVLDTVQQELLTALDKLSKSQMILFCGEFKNVFNKIHSQSLDSYKCPSVSKEFLNELVPNYDQATIVLNKFTECQSKANPVYSEPLHMSGLCWRLKIYPNGNGSVKGTYLSIFLELSSGTSKASKYEYRIEMINQQYGEEDPSKNVSREFASDFEVGECWGYNRFFQLDRLRCEGFILPDSDSLLIKFQIRSPTYELKCRDQEWYISQLETRQGQLLRELENLKSEKKVPVGDEEDLNNNDKPSDTNQIQEFPIPQLSSTFMARVIEQKSGTSLNKQEESVTTNSSGETIEHVCDRDSPILEVEILENNSAAVQTVLDPLEVSSQRRNDSENETDHRIFHNSEDDDDSSINSDTYTYPPYYGTDEENNQGEITRAISSVSCILHDNEISIEEEDHALNANQLESSEDAALFNRLECILRRTSIVEEPQEESATYVNLREYLENILSNSRPNPPQQSDTYCRVDRFPQASAASSSSSRFNFNSNSLDYNNEFLNRRESFRAITPPAWRSDDIIFSSDHEQDDDFQTSADYSAVLNRISRRLDGSIYKHAGSSNIRSLQKSKKKFDIF